MLSVQRGVRVVTCTEKEAGAYGLALESAVAAFDKLIGDAKDRAELEALTQARGHVSQLRAAFSTDKD